ncbi:MAG TPA: hypothetical protein VGR78_09515 [Verrucomicrobiae bacterium]|nr:hypothetical protein [Verrucomicrobiae bacterium]
MRSGWSPANPGTAKQVRSALEEAQFANEILFISNSAELFSRLVDSAASLLLLLIDADFPDDLPWKMIASSRRKYPSLPFIAPLGKPHDQMVQMVDRSMKPEQLVEHARILNLQFAIGLPNRCRHAVIQRPEKKSEQTPTGC